MSFLASIILLCFIGRWAVMTWNTRAEGHSPLWIGISGLATLSLFIPLVAVWL